MALRIAKRKPIKGEKVSIIIEESGRITFSGKAIRLTPQMTKMLVHLCDRSPRICTQEQLLVAIRPPTRHDDQVDVNVVKTMISKLRERLLFLTDLEIVETVRGVGYRVPNYVEMHTNVHDGEVIRIPSDIFAMLTNLTFEARKPFDQVVREVLIEGGKTVQRRALAAMSELPKDDETFIEEDPWS